jgi:hypothetical protein
METAIQTGKLELRVGQEIPLKDKGMKCIYNGIREAPYAEKNFKWVHEFVLGRYDKDNLKAIARVRILDENLHLDKSGKIIFHEYTTRVYFPNEEGEDQKTINRHFIFTRLKGILEGTK